MGWEEQQQQRRILEEINDPNNGGLFVKVMTDEQIEALRKQIAVYATICEQLVDLHRSLASPPDLPGVRFGNMYYDPSVTPGGHKLVGRQRWIPTQLQLQILELIFEQGDRKPGKLRIKEITSELSQHGQITETNVAYWFQNRRSRTRRKQHLVASNSVESEKERRIESPKEENTQSPHDQTPRFDGSALEP